MTARAAVTQWEPLVVQAVADAGNVVPVAFVLAIIDAESRGNPAATRTEAKINDASVGLMQILVGTARGVGFTGVKGDPPQLSGLYDPATNIRYGVRFLSSLWKQLGNAEDVASAYNGGIRPQLGFGRKAKAPVTVCLARDGTGKCVRSRTVQPGEYGNADYVAYVMARTQDYSAAQELPPVTITADPAGSSDLAVIIVLAVVVLAVILSIR